MENYKIIENRPPLTKEQIMQGMDFMKIKNNATLAKSTILKVKFLKCFISVIAISAIVFICKNYSSSVPKKLQPVVVEPNKVTVSPKKELIPSEDVPVIAKTDAILSNERKLIIQTPLITQKDTIDTMVTKEAEPFVPENNDGVNPEQEDFKHVKTYVEPFSKELMKELENTFAKINEQLYASKYEVTNRQYRLFINSLKKSGDTKILSSAQIDSLKWLDKSNYNSPYVDYYHAHSAYDNYPVVNVSYEGAAYFCEWLTEQYNANPKRKFKKIIFRLPSESEWVLAAQAGNNDAVYPWEGNNLDTNKKVAANFKRTNEDLMNKKTKSGLDITAVVNAYTKNGFGLFNMSGNVAEMVLEKGFTKGGSWKDDPEALKISSRYKYDGKPQAFVGFRYFVEIIEK